jgi:hypothetical protein
VLVVQYSQMAFRLVCKQKIGKPMTDIDINTQKANEDEEQYWKEVIQDDWELCYLSVCLAEMFYPHKA